MGSSKSLLDFSKKRPLKGTHPLSLYDVQKTCHHKLVPLRWQLALTHTNGQEDAKGMVAPWRGPRSTPLGPGYTIQQQAYRPQVLTQVPRGVGAGKGEKGRRKQRLPLNIFLMASALVI